MFSCVSINKKQKKTSIEELGNKNGNSNGLKLLRVSIFTNPLDKFNNNHLQNDVNNNNEECNKDTHGF